MNEAIMELLADKNANLYETTDKLGYFRNYTTKQLEWNSWTEDVLQGIASVFGIDFIHYFEGYEDFKSDRIGEVIKKIMKDRKVTFRDLGNSLDCSKQNISRKMKNMKTDDILAISDIMGLTYVAYFYDQNTGKKYVMK